MSSISDCHLQVVLIDLPRSCYAVSGLGTLVLCFAASVSQLSHAGKIIIMVITATAVIVDKITLILWQIICRPSLYVYVMQSMYITYTSSCGVKLHFHTAIKCFYGLVCCSVCGVYQ